jgi:putative ABC transport system permease protein
VKRSSSSRLSPRDLVAESIASITQRPSRTALTVLGTVLGVSACIAVLGLTTTADGQVSRRFTALVATEVKVEQVSAGDDGKRDVAFPPDADRRMSELNGVRNAGVFWPLPDDLATKVRGAPNSYQDAAVPIRLLAGSPGMLRAIRPSLREGRLYDEFHDSRGERVAVLGIAAARLLGIRSLVTQPAVFVDGVPFLVVGVLDDVAREPAVLSAVVVPPGAAEQQWGAPGADTEVKMVVDTQLGAARTVARQAAVALRPDRPEAFRVIPPPNPRTLQNQIGSDLSTLFLLLAAVCLLVGMVGVANTSLVAVLERVSEIGLRRALGADRRHIAAQFAGEAAALGILGGLVGTSLGVTVVVSVAIVNQWTPLIEPWTVAAGPFVGLLTGVLGGLYPALKAARIEPVRALQR